MKKLNEIAFDELLEIDETFTKEMFDKTMRQMFNVYFVFDTETDTFATHGFVEKPTGERYIIIK